MEPIDVQAQQAFLCGGDWDSWIGDLDDGVFTLRINATTGRIEGEHIYSPQEIYSVEGWCYHPPPRHFMVLTETRPNVTFTYFAEILRKASGKHRTKAGQRRRNTPFSETTTLASRTEDIFFDDEWMGVKTT